MDPVRIDRALLKVVDAWGLGLERLESPKGELRYLVTIPASVVGSPPKQLDRAVSCPGCGAPIPPWNERASCRYCSAPLSSLDLDNNYRVRIRFYADEHNSYVHENAPEWSDEDEDAWKTLAEIDVDIANRVVAEATAFADFDHVRAFLREHFAIASDEDGLIAVDFTFGDESSAEGPRTQPVEVVDYAVDDEPWVLLRCPILEEGEAEPRDLLARNDVLPYATIGLSEDRWYRLYYTVPLELLTGARLIDWVEQIASTADELEQEFLAPETTIG